VVEVREEDIGAEEGGLQAMMTGEKVVVARKMVERMKVRGEGEVTYAYIERAVVVAPSNMAMEGTTQLYE